MELNKKFVVGIAAGMAALGLSAWAATSNFLVLNATVAHSEFFDGPASDVRSGVDACAR
jgi:hypothetical protein